MKYVRSRCKGIILSGAIDDDGGGIKETERADKSFGE